MPRSAVSDGVSMPRNTAPKPAATIPASSVGSPARSTDASVYSAIGRSCAACHAASAGNSSATSRRLPMKLSSTRNTVPRQPRRYSASSSAITWGGVLTRGTRPKISITSQNSQRNGQPREYCTLIEA